MRTARPPLLLLVCQLLVHFLWHLLGLAAVACTGPSVDGHLEAAATDGTSFWTDRTPDDPASKPLGRDGAALAFDPVRKKAVLYGGQNGITLADLVVTAGGGAGLASGIGAADLRLFAGLALVLGASGPTRRVSPFPAAPAEAAPVAPTPTLAAGAAEADADGDGIPDARDRCPDEPEDKDGWQDEDGCPDPDNDHDGIPDAVDRCPNEPETINGVDDDDGCPDKGEPAVLLLADRIELLVPVRFQGSAVRSSARSVLGQVAATLRAHPEFSA